MLPSKPSDDHPCMRLFCANAWALLVLSTLTFGLYAHAQSITEVTIFDKGNAGEPGSVDVSIDTTRDSCSTDATSTPELEPFSDTIVGLTISNPSASNLRVSALRYATSRIGTTRRFTSKRLAPIGPLEVKAKTESVIYVPILTAAGTSKHFSHGSLTTNGLSGLRPLTVTVFGSVAGRRLTLRATTTVSFDNYNRCDGG